MQDTFEDANDTAEPEPAHAPSPVESTRSLTNRPSSTRSNTEDTEGKGSGTPPDQPVAHTNGHTDHDEHETNQPKSPLLTSHRLSTTSLDNVNLDEDGSPAKPAVPGTTILDPWHYHSGGLANMVPIDRDSKPPPLPPKSTTAPLTGLSGKLPSVPWSPPPQPPQVTSLATPAPPTRKLTSPFSWLSRNTSAAAKETVTSPPLPSPNGTERRNTASSILTISSNPEMMLSKLEEGDEDGNGQRPGRNSLKDRFKLLRMREEAGITSLGEDEKGQVNLGLGLASPRSAGHEEPPLSPLPKSPNLSLAPGTAAGVTAGPSAISDPGAPVDWDLWQAVVYEGPAAVARTSPEELNRAIATGIPNAIRGVVWQVLAQSKNEELESVYKDLVARGTDKDKDRMSVSSGAQSNGSVKEKETIKSSASSIHSDHSMPATTLMNGPRSPSPPSEKDIEASAKAQATALATKKKKAKEDAAALQKLEKTIKRDLGARTSFSKFAASAGLQDGLFGVCKAYALFDESVGYAQGMNFLAMPLLFNVRHITFIHNIL